jgi:hypothetical protein
MNIYYDILFKDDRSLGVAYTINKSDADFDLPYLGKVVKWSPMILDLRNGEYPDYLASNLGLRICSQRMKEVLEEKATKYDELQWLEVRIRKGKEERSYYILHFPNPPDVLNKTASILVDEDVVVKPVLSPSLTKIHSVFCYPYSSITLFISSEVKDAIEAAGLTGVEISKVPCR